MDLITQVVNERLFCPLCSCPVELGICDPEAARPPRGCDLWHVDVQFACPMCQGEFQATLNLTYDRFDPLH